MHTVIVIMSVSALVNTPVYVNIYIVTSVSNYSIACLDMWIFTRHGMEHRNLINMYVRVFFPQAILNDIGPEDALKLSAFALQPAIRDRIIQEVISHFHSQLQMQIDY